MTMTLQPADPPGLASATTPDVHPHQRAALAVAMLGFAVVALDAQITNVALPAVHRSFGGGLAGLQWAVTGYTLMLPALLLLGGSMADRIGGKERLRQWDAAVCRRFGGVVRPGNFGGPYLPNRLMLPV